VIVLDKEVEAVTRSPCCWNHHITTALTSVTKYIDHWFWYHLTVALRNPPKPSDRHQRKVPWVLIRVSLCFMTMPVSMWPSLSRIRGGWGLICLWFYKKNNKLQDWKNVFTLYIPPWAPHTYDFVVLTSLTHPRKIILVVQQIRKAKVPLHMLNFMHSKVLDISPAAQTCTMWLPCVWPTQEMHWRAIDSDKVKISSQLWFSSPTAV
jgi:hypothetical protein